MVLAGAQVTLVRTAGSSSLGSHPDYRPGSPGARRCAPCPAGSDRPGPVWEAALGSMSPALSPAVPRILSLCAESGCGTALNSLVPENPPSFQDSAPSIGRRRPGSPLGGAEPPSEGGGGCYGGPEPFLPLHAPFSREAPAYPPYPSGDAWPQVTLALPGNRGARDPGGVLRQGVGCPLPTFPPCSHYLEGSRGSAWNLFLPSPSVEFSRSNQGPSL